MPAKRGGRRGGRRGGGRGGHNGRGGRGARAGRGGRDGGFLRGGGESSGPRSKPKQRNFNKRGRYGIPDDVPMLMDLSEPKPNTFAYFGRRQVQEDAKSKGPLRNRPVEFIRAKEVYDPNRELFHKLTSVELVDPDSVEIHNLSIEPTPEQGPTPDEVSVDEDIPVESVEDESEEVDEEMAEEEVEILSNEESDEEDEELVEEEREIISIDESEEEHDKLVEGHMEITANDDADTEESEGEAEVEEEKNEKEDEEEDEDDDDNKDDDAFDLVFDNEPDMYIATHMPKRFAAQQELGPNIEHNLTLTIGKVQLDTSYDDDGNLYVDTRQLKRSQRARGMKLDNLNFEKMAPKHYKFETSSEDDDDDDDDDDYDGEDVVRFAEEIIVQGEANFRPKKKAQSSTTSETDATPEYGFLPEDFDFDVGRVSIDNVRFGISNLYHVRNCDLCGDDTTYAWVEEEELHEYLVANGVKPHRLDAFMKYACGDLLSQEYEEQPNYSDVYILETLEEDDEDDDDEEEDSDDEEQEGENIDMLLALAGSKLFRDQDFVPIEGSSKTRGTGRKKQLNLDEYDIDTELMEALQEQYRARREGKKRRKEQQLADAILNHDMLIKYAYSMHIKEIKSEFEDLLRDDERETMLFPPLDPHGNKTIVKLAGLYNMKSLRCGKTHQYIKVSKGKNTYTSYPSYDLINRVLRQRPRFPRRDVKEPRGPGKGEGKGGKGPRGEAGPGPHVREGDIVGEQAPEIGQENIGRRLLEKLGWKYGEGLGMNNKGINQPVVARVKKSKLGLKTQ